MLQLLGGLRCLHFAFTSVYSLSMVPRKDHDTVDWFPHSGVMGPLGRRTGLSEEAELDFHPIPQAWDWAAVFLVCLYTLICEKPPALVN